jgi:hypothetical protein
MTTYRNLSLIKYFLVGAFILFSQALFAQLIANNSQRVKTSDTAAVYEIAAPARENINMDQTLVPKLKTAKERRELMAYLKQINTDNSVQYNKSKARFYYRLATTFAKLRLYPLAMKCFLKTIQLSPTQITADTTFQARADSLQLNSSYLSVNSIDDSVINTHQRIFENGAADSVSKPIGISRIAGTFDDGKRAAGYAILFHVKQPVPGKRKIFSGTNVGHTFITLIKYNTDSSYVSLSFGFYPQKRNLLSATPLEPATRSVFKNDSEHQWDEVLGKFISRRRFERILALTTRYSAMQYHLCKNNCTDFGINAAKIAGIDILETSGSWPFGSGNNPAVTGQSILQGKFKDDDKNPAGAIFIENNIETKSNP